jgi:hypothetical protein
VRSVGRSSNHDEEEERMTAVTHVYEDRWGAIIDHAGAGFVEIRWYDTTSAMSVDEFQQWLTNFAAEVERPPARHIG